MTKVTGFGVTRHFAALSVFMFKMAKLSILAMGELVVLADFAGHFEDYMLFSEILGSILSAE